MDNDHTLLHVSFFVEELHINGLKAYHYWSIDFADNWDMMDFDKIQADKEVDIKAD